MREYDGIIMAIMFILGAFCTMWATDFVLTDTAMVTTNEKNWISVQRCLDKGSNVFVSKKDRSITCDVTIPISK